MWSKPWGYKEGFLICAGLFVTGVMLQTTLGKIQWALFEFPANVIALAAYLVALTIMHTLRKRVYFFDRMSRYSLAVPAIICVSGFTVVMGLIRQLPPEHPTADFLGFSQMISAWSFVLLYLWLLTILGMTILRVAFPLRKNRISFLLSHTGLFAVLLAATLGSADMKRLTMTVRIGEQNTEWRAANEVGDIVELPIAVELKNFTIDEYPPKLMVIDNENGKALPEKQPANLLLEEGVSQGNLLDWKISILKNLPQAAAVAASDTTNFVDFRSIGSACAVYAKAENAKTQQTREGWISCGSFMFPFKALRLDEKTSLVMPEREPQRFASDVRVFTRSGKISDAVIEVNKPLKIDGWKIYQLDYDKEKGRWSDISVFELVRDPWLPAVYTGIVLMALGAIALFVTAQKRKDEKEETT